MSSPTAAVSWARSQALTLILRSYALACVGGLGGELRERVADAHVALDRRVEQALGVGAELRVPDRRALREQRLDELRAPAASTSPPCELAARRRALITEAAAREVALLLVDRDRVRGLLPPLDERRRGVLVLGRDRDREALGEAERRLGPGLAGHQRGRRLRRRCSTAFGSFAVAGCRGRSRARSRSAPAVNLSNAAASSSETEPGETQPLLTRDRLPLQRLVPRRAGLLERRLEVVVEQLAAVREREQVPRRDAALGRRHRDRERVLHARGLELVDRLVQVGERAGNVLMPALANSFLLYIEMRKSFV